MKTRISLTLIAALLLIGAPAQALDFYFDGYGGLLQGSETLNPFPDPNFSGTRDPRDPNNLSLNDGSDAWSTFDWGTGVPPDSSMVTTGVEDGVHTVNGGFTRFGKLEHFNEVIVEYWEPGMTSTGMDDRPAQVTISWSLDLYASAMDAAAGTNPILEKQYTFLLNHRETFNQANIADCIDSVDGFSRPNHITACDDLFYVTEVSQDGEAAEVFDGVFTVTDTFMFDGKEYTLTVNGLYEADNPVDPDNSTFSLKGEHWSCEGGFPGSSAPCTTDVRFQITPEPAVGPLALVGLVGLALAGRRRRGDR